MSIKAVIECETTGCRAHSAPHFSAEACYRYERLCQAWCRYDLHLGTEDTPVLKDMCPRCAVEMFCTWVYVVIQGGDYFGSALEIRPEGYSDWGWEYDSSKHKYKAGRELSVRKGHSDSPREDGAHILPAFVFGSEK